MSLRYQKGRLVFGKDCDLQTLMDSRQGVACYVYDLKHIEKRYNKLTQSLSSLPNLGVHYAMKANAHGEILKTLKNLGSRVDVVSGGELKRALEFGFKPQDIIFSGVAKTIDEIKLALDHEILQINVESPQELKRIGLLARAREKRAQVALRMNPEVNPVTHPYITTGMSENKFGMDRSFVPELIAILQDYQDALHLRGLTMHIGSQLTDLSAKSEAISKLRTIGEELSGFGYSVQSLDIGGGVGVHYKSADESLDDQLIDEYGRIVSEGLKDFPGEVLVEPGRVLVARAGILVCRVEYIKTTAHKNFAIVNTGMHHFMRPSLYQAEHRILPVEEPQNAQKKVYDVVGPICESSDYLAKNLPLPQLKQGHDLVICDTGAYGFCMANNYNIHPLPDEIILGSH